MKLENTYKNYPPPKKKEKNTYKWTTIPSTKQGKIHNVHAISFLKSWVAISTLNKVYFTSKNTIKDKDHLI